MDDMKQEKKIFMAFDSDSSFSKQMDSQLLVTEKLELKIGAQVCHGLYSHTMDEGTAFC